MVRTVLKDNKVPGTSTGTRAAEAQARAQGLLQDSWERARLGCVRPGACLDQRVLNRKNFSKRKRENRGTQWLFREFSTAALASCTPPPSALGLWTQDKQPQHTPEAQLARTQISGLGAHNWKPWWARTLISGPAAWAHRPKAPQWACTPISGLGPTPETPGGRTTWSAAGCPRRTGPKPAGDQCASRSARGCLGTQTQSAWVGRASISGLGAHTWNPEWVPTPETLGGCAPRSAAGFPVHRPEAGDRPCNPINSLAAHRQPHLKAPILNNSHLAPVHRALQGLLTL